MANDRDLVLMHMKQYGSITDEEARQEYGMKRLAARICELRDMGMAIKTDMISCKNRRGGISKFAKYSLGEVSQ